MKRSIYGGNMWSSTLPFMYVQYNTNCVEVLLIEWRAWLTGGLLGLEKVSLCDQSKSGGNAKSGVHACMYKTASSGHALNRKELWCSLLNWLDWGLYACMVVLECGGGLMEWSEPGTVSVTLWATVQKKVGTDLYLVDDRRINS